MGIRELLRGPRDCSSEPIAQPIRLCEDPCAEHMLRCGQYCRLLLTPHEGWETDAVQAGLAAVQREMTLVPAGQIEIHPIQSGNPSQSTVSPSLVNCDAFLIDRHAVSNAQFERFVNAGGYNHDEYWPEEILPNVLQFLDQSRSPGPRFWQCGKPPARLRDHPVVGISWYEANAYALWAGKQLTSSEQWQHAGTWWKSGVRYPWGNSIEAERMNLAMTGRNGTAPVTAFQKGATPNGVLQLVGNVWEWVYASIDEIMDDGVAMPLAEPLGEIRGGAFDTYLPSQATCQFRSGLPLLQRELNVGFRCAVSARMLQLIDGRDQ